MPQIGASASRARASAQCDPSPDPRPPAASALWFRTAQVKELEAAAQIPNVHVFAPNCVIHTFTYDPHWWKITVGGVSSRDLIGALARGESVPAATIDRCEGLECSSGCRP